MSSPGIGILTTNSGFLKKRSRGIHGIITAAEPRVDERYAKNRPDAEVVRRALNRFDDVPTDQQNLSPSAVFLLTDRGLIWVRLTDYPLTRIGRQLSGDYSLACSPPACLAQVRSRQGDTHLVED